VDCGISFLVLRGMCVEVGKKKGGGGCSVHYCRHEMSLGVVGWMAGHKTGDGDSWSAFLNIAQLVSMGGGGGGLIGCFNKWGPPGRAPF
jgi:uncharacterized membrane protein